jgi:TolB protein
LFLLGSLAFVRAASGIPPEALPEPSHELRVRISDGATGEPAPARLIVIASDGRMTYPAPRASSLYHEAYFGHRFFYADGEFSVRVPPGRTIIRAFRGFEYTAEIYTLDIRADTGHSMLLSRFVDMPRHGWRSGDTHVHMRHGGLNVYDLTPEDLHLMQRAEDVHVVNALDNGLEFSGDIHDVSTPDHITFFGIEYRSAFWGHLGVLGITGSTGYGCCSKGQPAFPMNVDLVQQARAHGGTVVFAHPITMSREEMGILDQGWPSVGHGRELPIDVALGEVDAIDVVSYSNRGRKEFQTWYDLLNHGFRIPATAGTDAAVNRFIDPPLGGYRVYAKLPLGSWTYAGWLEAIRRGESFVTNGPLITRFDVMERPMGSVITLTPSVTRVPFNVDVVSQWPVGQVQIIVNGQVQTIFYPGANPYRVTGAGFVETGGRSVWIAVHATGLTANPFTIGSIQFAHGNPIYIEVPGKPIRFGGLNALTYVDWIDEVWALALSKGFTSNADRDLTALRLDEARRLIRSRTIHAAGRDPVDEPPVPEEVHAGTGGLPLESNAPPSIVFDAKSEGQLTFRFGPSDNRPESFELYDVTGRRLATRRLEQRQAAAGSWTWTEHGSGVTLSSGIYFAVFRGHDWSRTLRVAVVR